jgi:hypothetical protein
MSNVTDVVFVTPTHLDGGKSAERFKDIITDFYTRYSSPYCPPPVEDNGTRPSNTTVFHMAINYMDEELADALLREPWQEGTVVYIRKEISVPEIKTW